MQVKIHFTSPEIEKLYRNAGVMEEGSSGFDLINVEEITFTRDKPFALVNLGVVIKLPENYHALLIPRSSTFKKYNLIQTNHAGLIDESYCGIEDIWLFPALWLPLNKEINRQTIAKGTRLCQFILQPRYSIEIEGFIPSKESRGGLGSTDTN